MTTILSNLQKDYHSFVAEGLETASKYNVKGVALVFLCQDDECLTGYWNMDINDKLQVENNIRFDNIDAFIKANIDRYKECDEE